MSSASLFRAALLTSGFAARTIHAYTQVNIATPFMYKNIDPIVFPGEYDRSHLHSFYGSDAVTVDTQTSEELRGDCTNAENPNDMSTYWNPTLLYQSGDSWEPVPVMRSSAYYGLGDEPASIPFPENLQMLAETLEYAYKDGEPGSYHECPSGMQAMPQLRFSIRYDMREVVPNGWSGTAPVQLACGPAWCSHGDFINGWTEESGQALVDAPSLKDEYLSVNGALGNDGDTMSCGATDADPEHGTGDYAESVEVMSKRSVPAFGWTSRNRLARSRRGL
ncbi:hypothetical protein LTR37_014598 [Vermiconidia calcicola]|uniref:Uncharacterized protein n=1 Tax=Vermiconidia calcicola TaxID=1690605 RepID=A0ACC3MTY2_9PEZI|nr:hypothetical protein LTR37_014598 [Vermiconidia calcicola]